MWKQVTTFLTYAGLFPKAWWPSFILLSYTGVNSQNLHYEIMDFEWWMVICCNIWPERFHIIWQFEVWRLLRYSHGMFLWHAVNVPSAYCSTSAIESIRNKSNNLITEVMSVIRKNIRYIEKALLNATYMLQAIQGFLMNSHPM